MTTPFLRWGWLLLSACLYVLLGYTLARPQFSALIGLYALLGWGYSLRVRPLLLAQHSALQQPDRFLFSAAVLFRCLLLGATPALSDDYARFLWDGQLLINGINPFRYLPAELIAGGTVAVDPALYKLLNSPNYFTVYPPVNQAIFALAAWGSGGNVWVGVVLLRLPILLAELGTMWLMVKLLTYFRHNPNIALLYGLNPLVVLELTGNVHFEGLMIFFVLLAAWWWVRPPVPRRRVALSAGAFALGVITKLLPLMLLPLVVSRLGWRQGLLYSSVVGVVVCLLFAPFFDLDMLRHMLASIDLYFRKFEFNASLYYLIREAGFWLQGYNVLSQIGIWLSGITAAGLLMLAFFRPNAPWPTAPVRLLWMLTLYFAMATTVHPWYITSLVAATVFTGSQQGRPLIYPLWWSVLIWLSYGAYQTQPVQEKSALLWLEYVPVLLLFGYETFTQIQKLRRPLDHDGGHDTIGRTA